LGCLWCGDGPVGGGWVSTSVCGECGSLAAAGWVCLDPVLVAWDELFAGVEGEGWPVVEECLEFAGLVELVWVCPGVESVDVDSG
jgi:hypothetical protein